MSALEALAWTLPPSLAVVASCWLLITARADRGRIDALTSHAEGVDTDLAGFNDSIAEHAAELKRIAEQVSILADRR